MKMDDIPDFEDRAMRGAGDDGNGFLARVLAVFFFHVLLLRHLRIRRIGRLAFCYWLL